MIVVYSFLVDDMVLSSDQVHLCIPIWVHVAIATC